MTAYYQDESVTLHHGDCLDVLRTLPAESVDSVCTDPPYGLEFMGKEWDRFAPRDRPNASVWDGRRKSEDGWQEAAAERSGKGGGGPSYRSQHKGSKRCTICGRRAFSGTPCECPEPEWVIEHRQEAPSSMLAFQAWCTEWAREGYRVLKPGGHLLAFGGTRTSHRLACAIEDAGFEIRDSIAWLYGSGFPKSLDVSKAIDKAAGAEREVVGMVSSSVGGGRSAPSHEGWQRPWMESADARDKTREITAPATPNAARWQGWGTALKPAFEPIVMGRKPLIGTVAANVLGHGTGALNIDGCRVDGQPRTTHADGNRRTRSDGPTYREGFEPHGPTEPPAGRWPTNVILDDSQAAELDRQSGTSRDGVAVHRNGSGEMAGFSAYKTRSAPGPDQGYGGEGGASRFFPTFHYEAKAPTSERPRVGKVGGGIAANVCAKCGKQDLSGSRCKCPEPEWIPRAGGEVVAHPTVKPLDLMRWLVRLVTPPGGTVLDPFAGSGTTAEACVVEGFKCIAIEREATYLPLIVQRLTKPIAPVLNFGASA